MFKINFCRYFFCFLLEHWRQKEPKCFHTRMHSILTFPIQVLTRQSTAGNRTRNLLITSPTPSPLRYQAHSYNSWHAGTETVPFFPGQVVLILRSCCIRMFGRFPTRRTSHRSSDDISRSEQPRLPVIASRCELADWLRSE